MDSVIQILHVTESSDVISSCIVFCFVVVCLFVISPYIEMFILPLAIPAQILPISSL